MAAHKSSNVILPGLCSDRGSAASRGNARKAKMGHVSSVTSDEPSVRVALGRTSTVSHYVINAVMTSFVVYSTLPGDERIFVQDNHLSTTSFTPLYGTAKPDGPYVRRVLRWARVLPDDDSAITEMVSSFMAKLDWLTQDPRIQNTPIRVTFTPLVDRMDY
ncbi:hypothetical protein DFH11DRAFT_1748567 [Phellopilus nigrolimitatus]|nr:hypothetical protein DFH11DRAFT_1748567 [Phellopilus nigrolimitatus]